MCSKIIEKLSECNSNLFVSCAWQLIFSVNLTNRTQCAGLNQEKQKKMMLWLNRNELHAMTFLLSVCRETLCVYAIVCVITLDLLWIHIKVLAVMFVPSKWQTVLLAWQERGMSAQAQINRQTKLQLLMKCKFRKDLASLSCMKSYKKVKMNIHTFGAAFIWSKIK